MKTSEPAFGFPDIIRKAGVESVFLLLYSHVVVIEIGAILANNEPIARVFGYIHPSMGV